MCIFMDIGADCWSLQLFLATCYAFGTMDRRQALLEYIAPVIGDTTDMIESDDMPKSSQSHTGGVFSSMSHFSMLVDGM